MTNSSVEYHPLPPFLPTEAKVLILGSFPPQKIRWSMDFYYPNLQNDMWRIMGMIFYSDKDYFLTSDKKNFDERQIKFFCTEKGIAISDAASAIIRLNNNASDKYLEIVQPINLDFIFTQIPHCRAIITTGQKATDTLLEILKIAEPKIGSFTAFSFAEKEIRLYRMPSSSRAYPKSLPYKTEIYKAMFDELGII
jgi:G:T/U-mismatch repair DNA glycosylase